MNKQLLFIAVILFFLFNCKREEETAWDVAILSPVVQATLTIDNLVADSILSINSDNTVDLDYKFSFSPINEKFFLQVPDTIIKTVYGFPFLSPFTLSPGSQFVNDPTENEFDLGDAKIKFMTVSSGELSYRIESNIEEVTFYTYTILKTDDGNGNLSGSVRVFRNNNNVWEQIGNDINGENELDYSGNSVNLSSDGTIIVIGASRNNGSNGTDSGHVRIFRNNNNVWEQVGIDIDGKDRYNESGYSVSLSSTGNIVAIGAPKNNDNGLYSGHVRVYNLSTVLSTSEFLLSRFSIFPNPVQNSFTIQLKENIQLKKVRIYNNLGQLITSSKKLTINTSTFSSGIYFVEIETNKGKATKKLVIN